MLLAFLITMMEQLLHYCWKHKLFPLEPITTTDGLDVEVIDPGLYNPFVRAVPNPFSTGTVSDCSPLAAAMTHRLR